MSEHAPAPAPCPATAPAPAPAPAPDPAPAPASAPAPARTPDPSPVPPTSFFQSWTSDFTNIISLVPCFPDHYMSGWWAITWMLSEGGGCTVNQTRRGNKNLCRIHCCSEHGNRQYQ